jgi:hypothetical protein
MEIDKDVRPRIVKRILALIADKRRSIVSVSKLRLITGAGEEIFGLAEIRLVDEYI